MAEKATWGTTGQAYIASQPESVPERSAGRPLRLRQDNTGRGAALRRDRHHAASWSRRVEDGSTVSDFDEVEIRQGRSVNLTLAPFLHNDVKVNLLDTPGYADFVGDLRAGLRAADAALFAVFCTTDGIDGLTSMLSEAFSSAGTPRAVVITKLDHHGATSTRRCKPAAPPSASRSRRCTCRSATGPGTVEGLIGLLSERYYDYTSGKRTERDSDPESADQLKTWRGGLDRVDHPGERGRGPHGQVSVRRGDRPEDPHRGPGEGGRQGQLLPRDSRGRAAGHRPGRAARADDAGVPVPRTSTRCRP